MTIPIMTQIAADLLKVSYVGSSPVRSALAEMELADKLKFCRESLFKLTFGREESCRRSTLSLPLATLDTDSLLLLPPSILILFVLNFKWLPMIYQYQEKSNKNGCRRAQSVPRVEFLVLHDLKMSPSLLHLKKILELIEILMSIY